MGILYTKYKTNSIKNTIKNYNYDNTEIFIPDIKYAYVIKVYDGDTFTIGTKLKGHKDKLFRFSIRIKGIDCPELRTKDFTEKEIALLAKYFVIEKIREHENIVKLDNIIYDKYGRLCADVYVGNILLKDLIINNRLGVEYYGGTKNTPKNWRNYYENSENNQENN
jgi:micrococcal nuclease